MSDAGELQGGRRFGETLGAGVVGELGDGIPDGDRLTGLDVRRVDFYFADVGSPGAVLVVEGQDGETIETVPSQTTMFSGDTRAQFFIGDANGPRISRLVIETPNGVTASLDELVIWALQ